MKKSILFLLLFLLLLSQVVAQQTEYTIMETELVRLENILQNWESNKQKQQLQVKNLKIKLQQALTKSEILSSQLQTERATSKNLRLSYEKSESEKIRLLNKYETEKQELKEKKAKLELKTQKQKTVIITLSFILGGLVLGSVGIFLFKAFIKKGLLV